MAGTAEIPSISKFVIFAPASSAAVGKKSQNVIMWSEVVFYLIIPGQEAIIYYLTPPSCIEPFLPLKGPAESKKVISWSAGPLSPEKKTIVSSKIFKSVSLSITAPTILS